MQLATERVLSEITGKVWKIIAAEGETVKEEGTIVIIESMKMEIPVLAPIAGTVVSLQVKEGDDVAEGQEVAVVEG